MKNEQLVDPASSESIAATEWQALLGRLRAGTPAGASVARVRQLRSAIARGEFQVDAQAIAARLIRRMLAGERRRD